MDDETETLTITVEQQGSVARLSLHGEVDIATAPQLAEAFASVLDDQPDRVEIDCTHLTFLDSSGIQVLVAAWDQMRGRAQMPVVLQQVSPLIMQVLEACGIRDLLIE